MKVKNKEKILMSIIGLFLIFAVMPGATYATVPGTINYQGYLADDEGTALDGVNVNMTFRIYDAVSGGNLEWAESHSNIFVSKGIFNVILGTGSGDGPIEPTDIVDGSLWLEVEVAGETLAPRQKLTGSAFAIRADLAEDADKLDGLDSTDFGDITGVDAGNGLTGGGSTGAPTLNVGAGTGISVSADAVSANTTYLQRRVTGTCGSGSSIRVINSDGTVSCEVDTDTNTQLSDSQVDTYVANELSTYYVPYDSGSELANSSIYYNGNVGIGTTSPSSKLHVYSTTGSDSGVIYGYNASYSTSGYIGYPGRGVYAISGDGNEGALGTIWEGLYAEGASTDAGVRAVSESGEGVRGTNTDSGNYGILGNDSYGVSGYTSTGAGVYGSTNGSTTYNQGIDGSGVYGIGTNTGDVYNYGVRGVASGNKGVGVLGFAKQSGVTSTYGVVAWNYYNGAGLGIWSYNGDIIRGYDNDYPDTLALVFKVSNSGNVTADGSFTGGGADFAEMIAVSTGGLSVEPGDIMVIDPDNQRAVVKASQPRSTLVCGIYSTKPGFIGSESDWDKPAGAQSDLEEGSEGLEETKSNTSYTMEERAEEFGEIPLAVVGIVPCKVSAENGSIRPGDLLVTSGTPGHAMRDDDPGVGTVLGKALGSLDSGTGVIKVLVTLQ